MEHSIASGGNKMDERNKTTVQIFGEEYTLVGTESEAYMQKICQYVDRLMRNLSYDSNLSTAKVSVLTAINMSDGYHKAKEALEQANAELEQYRAQGTPNRDVMAGLQKENEFLKDELKRLKAELERKNR
ncbi:MAG: cell division protein ZapA [Ruminococcaceae bacterium]|nr:cell division protein ZapA [Oscillospiraceae bacterium]